MQTSLRDPVLASRIVPNPFSLLLSSACHASRVSVRVDAVDIKIGVFSSLNFKRRPYVVGFHFSSDPEVKCLKTGF